MLLLLSAFISAVKVLIADLTLFISLSDIEPDVSTTNTISADES